MDLGMLLLLLLRVDALFCHASVSLVHAVSGVRIVVVNCGRIVIKGSTVVVLSVKGLLWTMLVVRGWVGWRWRGVATMADEGKGSSMGSSIVLSGGRIHGMMRGGVEKEGRMERLGMKERTLK